MADQNYARRGRLTVLIVTAAILAIVLMLIFSSLIQKYLWMRQLDYSGIFWTILSVQWGLFCAAFVAAFLYLWINLWVAMRSAAFGGGDWLVLPGSIEGGSIQASPAGLRLAAVVVSTAVGLIFATLFYSRWDTFLRFRYGGSFGLPDPLFGTDTGFFVFHLPLYQLVQNSLTGLTLLTLVIVLFPYGFFRLLQTWGQGQFQRHVNALPHLSILLLFLVASWGWGFYLDLYELVYSTLGVVDGAGYTAAHVIRVVLWLMVGASAALCALLALNAFRPRFKVLAAGAGIYGALYLGGMVLPSLVQRFRVQPNELQLETPYLKSNIDFTRKAFALDAIQETFYPALTDLTPDAIARNEDTIQNVRLWDWRPLLQTYRQTQEIRLYYQFYNVDVDRYRLEDGYHQVMLSTRELAAQLPPRARTWVNEYLQFTHGYGEVMSFVSKSVGGGFPLYLLENIPPASTYGLTIAQPDVYFGEAMPGYRIVGTSIKEFDYPKGNQNVYASYQGKGGIPLDSWWRRALFAWTQSDANILLTSYLGPQSRIQIWRTVQERVAQIAPFLRLDQDPYAVLSEGKLYWIQDAYTLSDHFPYSTPHADSSGESLNYIRNSVKAVVDMYDGTVLFYAADPNDPVLAAYRRAFPGVFRNLSELSKDLRSHLRYPEDLFSIQADQYRSFHMTAPQVFYNQEDLWVFPQQTYAGTASRMEPYYILMKLPGSDELQYLLMAPFTPQGRDNMIAWMAARCDFPEYGKMLVYQLPKEKLVYGPVQIEAMVDQNTTISQQLSLWDQRGSRVIRGNLIVIPVENSFLYVEPVYLTAESQNLPQLQRVIVVSGDKVVMQPTLDGAISAVFGAPQPGATAAPAAAPARQMEFGQARRQFQDAQKAMQQGDWTNFGKAMEALKRLLAGPAQ